MIHNITRFQLVLTKFYLRTHGRELKEIQIVKFHDDKTKAVFIFDGEDYFAAQAVPFLNTIIASSYLFRDYSDNVQKFFLEHEYVHTKHYLLNTTLIFPISFFLLGVLMSFLGIVGYSLFWLIANNEIFFRQLIGSLIGFFISTTIVILITWPMELHADYYAFKTLGLENSQKVCEEIKAKSNLRKSNFAEKFIGRITHPYTNLSLWVYKKLNS